MLFSVLCLQSPVVRAASKSTTVACATSTDVSEAAANNPKPAGTVHYVTRQGAAGNFNVRLDPSIEDGGGVLELVAHKMNTIALLPGGERHARWSSAGRPLDAGDRWAGERREHRRQGDGHCWVFPHAHTRCVRGSPPDRLERRCARGGMPRCPSPASVQRTGDRAHQLVQRRRVAASGYAPELR